ncbi:MAG: reprolysin-like metallopeptidase [Robiginitalea sp.]|uniref:reprolysin-like metallopeptidase n=1 Tax=Robiginitalea sp. TaxID=1902411 RepID=UPI003C745D2B
MKTKLRLVLSIPLFFFSITSLAQDAGLYWEQRLMTPGRETLSGQSIKNEGGRAFALRESVFRQELQKLQDGSTTSVLISFPDASGQPLMYRVEERSVMAPELQQRYPDIRSYIGYATHSNSIHIRFSYSPKGLQGMVVDTEKSQTHYLEPDPDQGDTYFLFSRDMLEPTLSGWKCKTESEISKDLPERRAAKLIDDQLLRTYRLAVSTTGEYAQYHGGSVANALSAINATVTRVNEVFERDLAIALELIPETDQVIYTDPNTDPYGGNFSSEVQTVLTDQIGAGGYDIGHLFHQGPENGFAGNVGNVCIDSGKGSAFAATPNPEGDRFDLDFVAHEMGHQFGANHTWSFRGEGTGVQAEPGSGSTIMGYAGITQEDDVQPSGDDYFHYFSVLQISQYVAATSCAQTALLTNSPPQISAVPDYRIPVGTAFVLEGSASDADAGDVLTYAWEQIDDGVVSSANFGPENAAGANFRSLRPRVDSVRYFPRLSRVITGDLTQTNPTSGSAWETVATVARELNFALTVRDNAPGGGQVNSDLVKVRVDEEAGPFRLISQSSPQSYAMGSVQTVNWDVAKTDGAPINAQLVDIYLSADGGLSYPFRIGQGLPNIGSAKVQIPRVFTPFARFMVRPSENIFFSINSADFELTQQPFLLVFDALQEETCQGADAIFEFTYQTFGGFSDLVNFEVDGLPAGLTATFSTDSAQSDGTPIQLEVGSTSLVPPGTYPFEVRGTEGGTSISVPLTLEIKNTNIGVPDLTFPQNSAVEISLQPELQWEQQALVSAYDFQFATDPSFSAPQTTIRVYRNGYRPGKLVENTQYYWRVRSVTACGEGAYSNPFSFTTISSECRSSSAPNLPKTISAVGTPTITSVIAVADDRPILGVRVAVELTHIFVSDLVISLTSPSGTTVNLVSNSCGSGNDINAIFDAEAPPFICSDNPAISGVVRPLGSLSAFAGESSYGEWVLTIEDTAPADGGSLEGFSLELCVEGAFRPDADGDGVFDDGDDLCPGTPPGATVDANGCQVFRFPDTQFDISLFSESCIGSADGRIAIEAMEDFNYTVSVQGNGTTVTDTFERNYELGDLEVGSYTVCLGGTEGVNTYESQCFEVQIGSPDPISVFTNPASDLSSVSLILEGSEFFVITLNGIRQQVKGPLLTLDLKTGLNQLKVEGVPACKGVFEETFFRTQGPLIAPNPFRDRIEIRVPEAQTPVYVQVFNTSGILVRSRRVLPESGKVLLDLPGLPTGMYLFEIEQGTLSFSRKVFRE